MRDGQDTLSQLAASAARVHLLARDGLGLPELEVLSLLPPWRRAVAELMEQPDRDFSVGELTEIVVVQFTRATGMGLDHPAVAETSLPAWEAVARHLCQWINELADGDLRGLEASEALWKEWARTRGLQVVPTPAQPVGVA